MADAVRHYGVVPEDVDGKLAEARRVGGVDPESRERAYSTVPDLLRRRAEESPDAPFLTYYDAGPEPDLRLSRAAFRERVLRVAHFLWTRGLRRGDRIATLAHNHADTVIQYFAVWQLGCTLVPLNAGEDDARLAYILENAEVKFAFVRSECMGRLEALRKAYGLSPSAQGKVFPDVMTVGGPSDPFAEVLAAAPAELPPGVEDPAPGDQALIVYTSGTTGAPKGVVLTQDNLLVDAEHIAAWHGISPAQPMMCVLPIHHVNGTVVTLVTPLMAGSAVVLNRKFSSDTFWERAGSEKVGIVSVVPTLLKFLLEAAPQDGADPVPRGTFRHIICGAGPLTVELAAKFDERFQVRIVHGYGLSETTCYSCYLPLSLTDIEHASWMQDHGYPSIGVPIPCNEMAIHDENGAEVQAGRRGEIVIRGHNVMLGYYRNDDANRATFENGWFRSGDEGFMALDKKGRRFFFITGRLKELIIRGGVNLSPLEIDEVIGSCPGVRAGISVGFENEWYGEEVGAYIQKADPALTEEQVLAHCAAHLPFAKQPKVVVFGEQIPVTSTGKYQRNKVKDLFTAHRHTQFRPR